MSLTTNTDGVPAVDRTNDAARITPRTRAASWGFACALYVVFDGFSHGLFDRQITSLVSLTLLATLGALVLALLDGRADRLLSRARPRATTILLLVFVSYIAISATFGPGVFDLGFVKGLMLFAAIVALVDDRRQIATLLLVAGYAGVIQAALGVGQFIAQDGVPLGGLTGLLPNHIQYAIYLLLSAIALAPFVHHTKGARRIAVLLAEALIALALILSLARGVLVVAILAALAWLLLTLRSTRARVLAVSALGAGALTVLAASRRLSTLAELPAALGDPARLDALLSGRLVLLLSAWNMWLAHPVFGVGYGHFPAVWAQYAPDGMGAAGFLRLQLATHSTYLQIAAEMGIAGLGVYVALLGSAMRDAWQVRTYSMRAGDTFTALLASAVLTSLIAIAAHGLLDNTGWHDRVFYVALACAVAMRAWMARVAINGLDA